MTFEEVVHHRRSVRNYVNTPLDDEAVKQCIELATLAPNSSNMQLWEFYHVTYKQTLDALAKACFNQEAARTAQQLVVFVTRQDLTRQRAKQMLKITSDNIIRTSPPEKHESRIKRAKNYYGSTMIFLYSKFFRLLGLMRKLIVTVVGLFKPTYREATESDMRIVVHKSCALAAQTFMLAMASKGLDTCPMEGYDSKIVKRILKLPRGAEPNMIISCGVRTPSGVRGDRERVPFEQVYHKV